MKIGDLFEVTQGPCVAFENFYCTIFYPLLQAIKSRNSTGDAVNFISRSLDRTVTPRETNKTRQNRQRARSRPQHIKVLLGT